MTEEAGADITLTVVHAIAIPLLHLHMIATTAAGHLLAGTTTMTEIGTTVVVGIGTVTTATATIDIRPPLRMIGMTAPRPTIDHLPLEEVMGVAAPVDTTVAHTVLVGKALPAPVLVEAPPPCSPPCEAWTCILIKQAD